MNNIKFGLKLWSGDDNLINEAKEVLDKKIFDYIELKVIPNTDIFPFEKIKATYIIHMASEEQGLNIGDENKEVLNLKLIKESIEWGNKLSTDYLIIHPGFGKIETTEKFLEKIKDKRILIENMPKVGINNEKMTGFSFEEINELKKDKFGFCLDFGHAAKAALSLGIDYKQYIKELLSLNPQVFHISDGMLNPGKDEHLNIGEGEYDFNFLTKCIKKNNTEYITLETPRTNLSSLKEDLANIERLKLFLSFKKIRSY